MANLADALSSGKVSLKVTIDPYCPFLKYPAQSFSAEFNEFALNSVPEDVKKNISIVNGVSGIYLKEKYVYMHTFLESTEPCDAGSNSSPTNNASGTDTASGESGPIPLTPQVVSPDFWIENALVENCDDEQKAAVNIEDNRSYRREQTFVLTQHPLNKKITKFCNPPDKDEIQWVYNQIDVPQDGTKTGTTKEEQITCKNLKILSPGPTSSSIVNPDSSHWRVEKKTPLFRGEDFVLEFHNNAEKTNESTFNKTGASSKKPFEPINGQSYSYIDVNYVASPDELNASRYDPPPKNSAVVGYKIEIDQNDQDRFNLTLDESSKEYFNLHIQPYILIELGSNNTSVGGDPSTNPESYLDDQKYFIMITKNSNPSFIRIKNDVSYVLSRCDVVSGASLLSSASFRMTLRNHLGKFIIVFKGHEKNPWIIDPENITDKDFPMLTVPGRKIAIWSGNCCFSFLFFPLRYESDTRFTMPGGYKQHGQLYDFQNSSPPEDVDAVGLWVAQADDPILGNYVSEDSIGFKPNGRIFTSEANSIGAFSFPRFLGRAILKEISEDFDNSDAALGNVKSEINFGTKTVKTLGNLFRIHQFFIGLELKSGGHIFKSDRAENPDLDGGDFIIPHCKTPVLNQINVRSDDQTQAWQERPRDVTSYVESFSDSWSTSDYWKAEHSGNIRFLANKGTWKSNGVTRNPERDIIPLKNRAFYITVDVNYECQPSYNLSGINYNGTPVPYILRTNFRKASILDYDATKNGLLTIQATFTKGEEPEDGDTINLSGTGTVPRIDGNYTVDRNRVISETDTTITLELTINIGIQAAEDLVLGTITVYDEIALNLRTFNTRLFSGLCLGGKLTTGEAGERHLECQIKDFMYVLDNQFMINSPFFDGMRDIYAVRELLRIAMMRSDQGNVIFGANDLMPAKIINIGTQYGFGNDTVWATLSVDPTRYSVMAPYILPQSYDRLTNAYFKFPDGSKISDNIYEIAKKANKMMYFDQWGVFHFENRKFDSQFFNNVPPSALDPDWYFTTRSDSTGVGRLMYNTVSREDTVVDVYNEIKIMTSTPNGEAYIGANLSEQSIYGNPGSVPGWLGFKKTFIQFDGIFGSKKAVENLISYYSTFFNPPKVINFECYGLPCRTGDVIRVQFRGNEGFQDYVIYNVSNDINPRENKWWTQIEAEYLPTFFGGGLLDIDFSEDTAVI